MNQKWTELHKQITDMMHPLYGQRPTCAELLAKYDKWLTDDSLLNKKTLQYKQDFTQMRDSSNQFFLNYFIEKYHLQ